MFGFFKKNKSTKEITLFGEYNGSYAEFTHPVLHASITCTDDGIDLSFNKGEWKTVKHFSWSYIEGFDFTTETSSQTTGSRSTISRTVAFGAVGASMKKKSQENHFSIKYILYVKDGGIEINNSIVRNISGDLSKTATSMEQLDCILKAKRFKKTVLEKIASDNEK